MEKSRVQRSDADGYTSAALLINYLNCLFPHYAQTKIEYRLHEGKNHGLILNTIPDNVKLIIAPDSSSSDYEIHKILYERGIDVLVLDHHQADYVSPYACVINNQLCNYPNKSLTGVGIVYKFVSYLDTILDVNYASNFLDLVALGQIADMSDLRPFETHFLISTGLKQINNNFIKQMIANNSYTIQNELNPHKVSFYIAPFINAVNRMGSNKEKLILFESLIDFRGQEQILSTKMGATNQFESKIEQACRNCNNIKSRQTKVRDNNLQLIEQDIIENNLLDNKILIICQHNLNRELAGLIANILADKYQRPTLVLTLDKTRTNWTGSARSYGIENLRDFLAALPEVTMAQGHPAAFGISIPINQLNNFIAKTNYILKDYNFNIVHKIDAIYDSTNLREDEVLALGHCANLWGQNLEEPKILIKNIKINQSTLKILKANTLKITIGNISAIKFKATDEECAELNSSGYVVINMIGTCQINEWNGVESPQIKIEDYEIVKRAIYDF